MFYILEAAVLVALRFAIFAFAWSLNSVRLLDALGFKETAVGWAYVKLQKNWQHLSWAIYPVWSKRRRMWLRRFLSNQTAFPLCPVCLEQFKDIAFPKLKALQLPNDRWFPGRVHHCQFDEPVAFEPASGPLFVTSTRWHDERPALPA